MLVDFYPPPMQGHGGASESSIEYLRQQWIAGAWRRSSPLQKLVFSLSIVAWWPSVLLHAAYLATVLGRSRERMSGKSPFRQFTEQLSVAAKWMVPPKWYYIFEFFDDERRAHAGDYLQRIHTKPYIFAWLVDAVDRKAERFPFANKTYFAGLCERNDLPCCSVIAAVDKKNFSFLDPQMTDLPRADLFVKITKGRGGRGAEKWSYRAGRYSNAAGRELSASELISHIRRKARFEKRIVQLCMTNHHALSDLNLGALATVRVLTIRGERGEIMSTHAVFRMPQVRGICVDNFHAGGIASAVDLATGKLGRATDIGVKVNSCWHVDHPVTGARIADRVLPHWAAVLELAERAHRLIGDRVVVGWDVAILEDGPCLVEGNGKPDVDIVQRQYRQGLGETRVGPLLALHMAQRLAGNPLNGRAFAEVYPYMSARFSPSAPAENTTPARSPTAVF